MCIQVHVEFLNKQKLLVTLTLGDFVLSACNLINESSIVSVIASLSLHDLIIYDIEVSVTEMEKWLGKLAVVTGASAGIGEAVVIDLARHGINVVGLARRSEKVEEIARNLEGVSGKVYARKYDVSDQNSVEEAFNWIEERFGCIHILINNAGILFKGRILDEGGDVAEKLKLVVDTNLTGLIHCTRSGYRLIKKSDDYGLIVNVNSVLGHAVSFSNEPRLNVYGPTKYALTAVSEVLRQELIPLENDRIRVTNLSPGSVKTDIAVAGGLAASNDEFFDHLPCLIPENVSQSILFILQAPYNVNITQLTIKPVGEA